LIRFQAPRLPPIEAVAAYFARSEEIRWYSNFGPCHALLVERLEARLAGLRCVPLCNGTLALTLAIRALAGRTRNAADEVLMPSFTFVAVINAVLWAGLRPVFVDVEPDSWHMAPDALASALAAREGTVRLVLACSTFGFPPPATVRDQWAALAAQAGVPLLVDSAAGFGAVADDGQVLGGQGDAEVFSLHATKPFAIGEGGLLTTADEELAETAQCLSNFGITAGNVDQAGGINAKLAEWPAATALVVLDGYDDILVARRETANVMLEALAPLGFVGQRGARLGAWQFVPMLAPTTAVRDAVLKVAIDRGIELRTYYQPLHQMPAFRDVPCEGGLDTTAALAGRALSLPMANDLSARSRDAIVECLAAATGVVEGPT
jgi:dTDP-4-amino-4,6-dideoxygalactose transaminase